MPQLKLTHEEFEREYLPQQNHLDDNASSNGRMFETYGPEVDYVIGIANSEPGRVWTLVECDATDPDETDEDGDPYTTTHLVSGFHLVNRMGYIITKKSVPEGDDVIVEDY